MALSTLVLVCCQKVSSMLSPSGSKWAYDEGMLRDLVNARIDMEILSAINNANEEAVSASQPVELDARELSRLHQLIILPGKSGCLLMRTGFEISMLCAEEKLKKYT
jgi:hypothetical protein